MLLKADTPKAKLINTFKSKFRSMLERSQISLSDEGFVALRELVHTTIEKRFFSTNPKTSVLMFSGTFMATPVRIAIIEATDFRIIIPEWFTNQELKAIPASKLDSLAILIEAEILLEYRDFAAEENQRHQTKHLDYNGPLLVK